MGQLYKARALTQNDIHWPNAPEIAKKQNKFFGLFRRFYSGRQAEDPAFYPINIGISPKIVASRSKPAERASENIAHFAQI